MILPDANLLLYAYNRDRPFHVVTAAWWSGCLSNPEPIGLTPGDLFAFVRVGTNPRAFPRPLSVSYASGLALEWLEQYNVQMLDMQPRDVTEALSLLTAAGTAGNLTSDAQLAAIALRTGAVVHTGDTDFYRFPKLRWFNPVTGRGHKQLS